MHRLESVMFMSVNSKYQNNKIFIFIFVYTDASLRPLFSFYLFILIDLVEKKNGSAWCNCHGLKEVYTQFILSDLGGNKFCD